MAHNHEVIGSNPIPATNISNMKILIFYLLPVYLTGLLAAFLICKRIRKQQHKSEWSDVIITIIISLLSWLGVLLLLVLSGVEFLYNKLESKKIFKKPPPKWM